MLKYWNELNNPALKIYKEKLDHAYKDVLKLMKILSAFGFSFQVKLWSCGEM